MSSETDETLKRLKLLRRKGTRMIRRRTAAEIKMLVHDRLGGCVFGTMRALEVAPDAAALRELCLQWEDALRVLCEEDAVVQALDDADVLSDLDRTAGQIGCKIVYDGDLPTGTHTLRMMAQIINEVLPNAVRHGCADTLKVAITHAQDKVFLEITNNGPIRPEVIKEGSGLSALRERLESEGGLIRFITGEDFIIHATLPV